MNGWYIAIQKEYRVGRGIFDEQEGAFEITDVHTSITYTQKELLRHRICIENDVVSFFRAGKLQCRGQIEEEEAQFVLDVQECPDKAFFCYEHDDQNYKTCVLWIESDVLKVEIFGCDSGMFFEEENWIYVPMYWYTMWNSKKSSVNSLTSALIDAIGDQSVVVDGPFSHISMVGVQIHSAELMVFLERPEFEGLQSLHCRYMKWQGDLCSVLQSAWHMETIQSLDLSFSDLQSDRSPCISIPRINLSFCGIRYVSFLEQAYHVIETLFVGGNPLIDWDVIYKLTNLRELDVRCTNIELDMSRISKKLKILRADAICNFDPQNFPEIEILDVGMDVFPMLQSAQNIPRPVAFSKHQKSLYFWNCEITESLLPSDVDVVCLYIYQCTISETSLQVLSSLRPKNIYIHGLVCKGVSVQKLFENPLFSNVQKMMLLNMNLDWAVLSSSRRLLQLQWLWLDCIQQEKKIDYVGHLCSLEFLCIENLEQDIDRFKKSQALPMLTYFLSISSSIDPDSDDRKLYLLHINSMVSDRVDKQHIVFQDVHHVRNLQWSNL